MIGKKLQRSGSEDLSLLKRATKRDRLVQTVNTPWPLTRATTRRERMIAKNKATTSASYIAAHCTWRPKLCTCCQAPSENTVGCRQCRKVIIPKFSVLQQPRRHLAHATAFTARRFILLYVNRLQFEAKGTPCLSPKALQPY